MSKDQTWLVIGALAVGAYLYGKSRNATPLPSTNLTAPGASTSSGNAGSAGCLWLDYNGVCTSDPSSAWFYLDGTPIGVSNIGALPNVSPGNSALIDNATGL